MASHPQGTHSSERLEYTPAVSSDDFAVRKLLVIGICFLCSLTDIKAADIQTVEVFGFLCLFTAAAFVYRDGLVVRGHRETIFLLKMCAIIVALTVILAFVALRLPTFPPPATSALKTAPLLSLARVGQLIAAMGSLILIIAAIVKRPTLVNLAAQVYVYAGLLGAAYGLISWIGLWVGIELGGAYKVDFPRAKGFFFEGGPFGVYLVSVIMMCVFRRRVLRRGTQFAYWVQMGLLFAAFYTSSSKAGYLLVALLALHHTMLERRLRYLFGFMLLAIPILLFTNLVDALKGYVLSYMNFEEELMQRSDDPSLMMGRGMAFILMPIMLADHPLTGIGFGNYSLQRNNPDYLGPLPTTDLWDLPGLGLIGYAAEFGLPLFFLYCWLLWRPVTIAKREGQSTLVALTASYQILAHLMGAQLTFAYPWVVSAIVIGYSLTHSHTVQPGDPS